LINEDRREASLRRTIDVERPCIGAQALSWGAIELHFGAAVSVSPINRSHRAKKAIPENEIKNSSQHLSNSVHLERQCAGGAWSPTGTGMETKMKYMLLIYANEAGRQAASETENGQILAAYGAYVEAMNKAGAYVGGDRLRPTTSATTVHIADGKTTVLDGPYAETKEQLGGYFLIDVPDLDAAVSWAARCPGASHGVMEIRPIWTM
jgi:hypothetical protein